MKNGIAIIVLRWVNKNRRIKHFLPLAGIFDNKEPIIVVANKNININDDSNMVEENEEEIREIDIKDETKENYKIVKFDNHKNIVKKPEQTILITPNPDTVTLEVSGTLSQEESVNPKTPNSSLLYQHRLRADQPYINSENNDQNSQKIVNDNYDEYSTKLNKDAYTKDQKASKETITDESELLIKRDSLDTKELPLTLE